MFSTAISSKANSIIDYIHASTNFAAAAYFYKRGDSRGGHAATALDAGVLIDALMTDYEYRVCRVWSFKTHGILDYGVALPGPHFPKLLDIEDSPDAVYFMRKVVERP